MFSVDRENIAFWLTHIVDFLPTGKHEEEIYKAVHVVPDGDKAIRLRCGTPQLMFSVGGISVGDTYDAPEDFAVSAAQLRHVAVKGGGDAEDVVLFDVAEDHVVVMAGDFTTKLDRIPTDKEISPTEEDEVDYGSTPVTAFADALDKSTPFLSKDSARPELMGVYLAMDKKLEMVGKEEKVVECGAIYASNGEHGAVFTFPDLTFPEEGLNFIPHSILNLLRAAGSPDEGEDDKEVSISSTDEWVIFEGGPFTLYLKRYSGLFSVDTFTDTLDLGSDNTDKITVQYDSLCTALDRVRFFADSKGILVIRIDRKRPYLAAISGTQHRSKSFMSATTITGKNYDILIPVENLEALLKVKMDKVVLNFSTTDIDAEFEPPLVGGIIYLEHENLRYWLVPTAR